MDPTREELEAMLADYVDGSLTGDELARAEVFLGANPGVREVMGRLMVDSEAIRTLPRVAPPVADISEDLRGQLERDMLLGGGAMPVAQRRRVSTPALAIAAMLVVGIGAGVVAYEILAKRPEPSIIASNLPEPAKPTATRDLAVATNHAAARGANSRDRSRVAATRPMDAGQMDMAAARKDEQSAASGPLIASAGAANAPGGGAAGGSLFSMPGSAGATVQLAAGPVPDEVIGWVATHADAAGTPTASRRAIVFVVDEDRTNNAAAAQLTDAATVYFRSYAATADADANADVAERSKASRLGAATLEMPPGTAGPDSLANARDSIADRAAGLRSGGESQAMTNVAATSPVASAIAAERATSRPAEVVAGTTASFTPVTVIARDVPESLAARWQAQADATLGVGKLVAYDVPPEVFARSQGIEFDAADKLKTTTYPSTAATATDAAPTGTLQKQSGQLGQVAQPVQMQQRQSMTQVSGVPIEVQQAQAPALGVPPASPATQMSTVDVYVVVRPVAGRPSTQPTTMP